MTLSLPLELSLTEKNEYRLKKCQIIGSIDDTENVPWNTWYELFIVFSLTSQSVSLKIF